MIGPDAPIMLLGRSWQIDYEVEFAVITGRTLHGSVESIVMESIFGYTILHDLSARDVQFKDAQIKLGKNFDTLAPIGPCIATSDEIPDPTTLRLQTFVNGTCLQDGSTRDWAFSLPRGIGAVAEIMTLEPGNVATTGTPAGVGVFPKPQIFLRPGDQVVLEIENIGRLETPVVSETRLS